MTPSERLEAEKLELVELVIAADESPPDRWAVAVALETCGLRDVDAKERFGASDLFELSADIHERCRARLAAEPPAPSGPVSSREMPIGRFVVCYGRGIFLALPMVVVQAGSIAGLQLSGRLTSGQATALALGTVLSLVAAGGFVQAIGRLGHLYRASADYRLAQRTSVLLIAIGFAAATAATGLFALVSLAASLFPVGVVGAISVYAVLLAALWLVLAVIYMLERPAGVLISIASWVGMLVLLFRFTSLGTYEAHWASIAFAILVAAALARRELRRLAQSPDAVHGSARLPPLRYLVRSVAPYLAYGVLYFALLFTDRFVAWLAQASSGYALFFSRPYELGMNWAALSLVLTVALLNYTVHTFALVGAFFGDTVTYNVVVWAILGYALLVWGLLNSVFLFFLSLPKLVLRSLVPALAANVAVGLVLSQTGEYWQSVVGLAAGGLVFAFLTTRYTIRVLRELDYRYYASC